VGGEGYKHNLFVKLVQKYNISSEVAEHLSRTYGTRAWAVCELTKATKKRWPRFGISLVEGYPFLENEVEYAVKHEYACTVCDILSLRTRLAFLNSEAARHAAPRVAEIMAPLLNWSDAERERQLEEALCYLAEFGGPYPNTAAAVAEPTSPPRASVSDISALFHRLDWDGNGYIDQSELLNAASALGFAVGSQGELMALFDRLPGASAGRIYEDEFITFFQDNRHQDALLQRMDSEFKLSVDRLEKNARGVMFG